jgi:hypothetical protein
MGLFTGLLMLPLAPVRGVTWIAEQVLDLAEREVSGDQSEIVQQLAELDEARSAGVIPEQECADIEERLVAELMRLRSGYGGFPEMET